MFGETPEVLIVGAGPVGQFTALSLARSGVKVRIVDRGIWPCAQSYALALDPQSLELFRAAGLLEQVLSNATPVHRMRFYEAMAHRATVEFEPPHMAVVRQDRLESLLERALDESGVEIQWRHEVPQLIPGESDVEAKIDRFEKESRGYIVAHTEWVVAKSATMHVPFVVGADGYNSRVRRALKLGFTEVGPAQYFAVFEFETDANLGDEMRVVLGDRTTDVLWPLAGGWCRWSFELPDYHDRATEELKDGMQAAGFDFPTERKKERMASYAVAGSEELDEGALRSLIAERAPWFAGSIGELAWRSVVRFERRLAPAFGVGRMWLAGDSAHLTGPVGVQSMNTGLHEAASLADALHDVLRNGASMERLEAYGRQWTGVWRELHGLDAWLKPTAETETWIAERAPRLLACLPGHGEAIGALAGQLGLAVEKGASAGV
jgi:2-polyprenyl-6-methoxyphenol hydroxylase-like FAD-dependent oxidoreductase